MKVIKSEIFDFLNDIRENNNRPWFLENKERYLKLKKEIETFNNFWFSELNSFDKSLQDFGEKPYLFRVYRDARFAKGAPYKTNFGLLIAKGGKPNLHKNAGYFLNIEPGKSFLAGGIWRPESDKLNKIRENIISDSSNIKKILNNKKFKEDFIFTGNKLKTAPRGIAKDHPEIELLRHKDFIALHHFTDEEVMVDGFFGKLVKLSETLHDFNSYLNNVK